MTQSELPLEWPEYDHYTVEIRSGPLFEEKPLRTHTADSPEDALNLIEGLRDTYGERMDVTWDGEEVDGNGILRGLAPEGVVFVISVVPPLSVEIG
jgi:hypothetical protein